MDWDAAIAHLKKDHRLQSIIQTTTVTPYHSNGDVYYDLLNSIASQQLSVKAADTIFQRFCALFPKQYPNPELLQSIEIEQLRAIGLSYQKAGYMKNVADFSAQQSLTSRKWADYPDADNLAFLTQIKGVGKWTAEIILMFTLNRPDIFPADDLGIQQAIIRLYDLSETGKPLHQRMHSLADPWRPYRTVACRYLWAWKNSIKSKID